MKFCYIDESGKGQESIFVIAGILVDAMRMHVTKVDWEQLLGRLSKKLGKPVAEFHTCQFYKGNGIWRKLTGEERTTTLNEILDWLAERRHTIVFAAIEKSKADKCVARLAPAFVAGDGKPLYWKLATMHLMLSIQKSCQTFEKNKGHTVLVCDQGVDQETIANLVLEPPQWTDTFYGFKRKSRKAIPDPPLDMIVDVPYFADSKHVGLLEMADLFAYLLRHHTELQQLLTKEAYVGEKDRVAEWVERLAKHMTPDSHRWLSRGGCDCSNLYRDIAPNVLLVASQ